MPVPTTRKPRWLQIRPGGGEAFGHVRAQLETLGLHTVCEEARCPNRGECWSAGTATIMILGDVCTRGCRFCAVATGNPHGALDADEPERVAHAVAELGLRYVVLTSVDRDDLPDLGAGAFAAAVAAIRRAAPETRVEVLIPDFGARPELLETLLATGPDVVAHNVETTRELTPRVRDKRASYETSLDVLSLVKHLDPARLTKTSLMLGLGESDEDVLAAMRELRALNVDILTLGQYLQPTPRHLPVERYVTPETFAALEAEGRVMGFRFVAAGPLVRSSYRAGELYLQGALAARDLDKSDSNC